MKADGKGASDARGREELAVDVDQVEERERLRQQAEKLSELAPKNNDFVVD